MRRISTFAGLIFTGFSVLVSVSPGAASGQDLPSLVDVSRQAGITFVHNIGDDDMDIDGERIFHRAVLAQYTWPVNRAGNPALALPIESDGTPPSSLQLIGPRWGEASLLAIGLGLEEAGIVKVEEPPVFFD